MAQHASVSTSESVSSLITFAKVGIAFFTFSNSGNGLPLQRFDNAQVPCLIVYLLLELSMILINGSKASHLSIISLYIAQSPAIFPKAQIAYSAMS